MYTITIRPSARRYCDYIRQCLPDIAIIDGKTHRIHTYADWFVMANTLVNDLNSAYTDETEVEFVRRHRKYYPIKKLLMCIERYKSTVWHSDYIFVFQIARILFPEINLKYQEIYGGAINAQGLIIYDADRIPTHPTRLGSLFYEPCYDVSVLISHDKEDIPSFSHTLSETGVHNIFDRGDMAMVRARYAIPSFELVSISDCRGKW